MPSTSPNSFVISAFCFVFLVAFYISFLFNCLNFSIIVLLQCRDYLCPGSRAES
jgi:hypothetical protein